MQLDMILIVLTGSLNAKPTNQVCIKTVEQFDYDSASSMMFGMLAFEHNTHIF